MKNFLVIIIFVINLLIACKEDAEEVAPASFPELSGSINKTPSEEVIRGEEYIIKKGSHQSNNGIKRHISDELKFKVLFDESSIYATKNSINQASINKLFGFSDCGTHHHQNSARIGWRYFNEKLELLAYVYNQGERDSQSLAFIEPGKIYSLSIRAEGDNYIFSSGNSEVKIAKGCSNNQSFRYKLFPYFGGREPAPHDIRIIIEEI
jgi:hypothetical protein